MQLDHPHVALAREAAILIEDVGDATAHPRREIPSGPAQHDDGAARHVLTSVIANALDHRACAAVAHREAFTGEAAEERLAGGGSVERDVADQDILLSLETGDARRPDRHEAAGESLAAIVIRVAFEVERNARRQPCAKTLSRRTGEVNLDGVWGQATLTLAPRDLRRKDRPDRTIHIADGQMHFD